MFSKRVLAVGCAVSFSASCWPTDDGSNREGVCVLEGTVRESYRDHLFPLSGVEIRPEKRGLQDVSVETDDYGQFVIWDPKCIGGPFEVVAKDDEDRTLQSRERLMEWGGDRHVGAPRYRPHRVAPFVFPLSLATAKRLDVRLSVQNTEAGVGEDVELRVYYELLPTDARLTVGDHALTPRLAPTANPTSPENREHVYRFTPDERGDYTVTLESVFHDVIITREASLRVR